MSYGGMWDMSDFKRCSGYKGHWECWDDHPDHMVPREKFNRHSGMSDGLQDKCKKCHRYGVSLEKHPTTGELKRNWKTDHAKSLGGVAAGPWRGCGRQGQRRGDGVDAEQNCTLIDSVSDNWGFKASIKQHNVTYKTVEFNFNPTSSVI